MQIKEKHDDIGFFDLEVQTQTILETCEVYHDVFFWRTDWTDRRSPKSWSAYM